MPHHWILFAILINARTLQQVGHPKPMATYYEVTDCLKDQAGRVSKVKDGTLKIYVCSHPKDDKET